jgi:hypothetical protein
MGCTLHTQYALAMSWSSITRAVGNSPIRKVSNIEKAMDEQKQESDYIERLETLQESR